MAQRGRCHPLLQPADDDLPAVVSGIRKGAPIARRSRGSPLVVQRGAGGYAVAATPARIGGLASLDQRRPGRTVKAILGNVTNRMESGRPAVQFSPSGTGNLLAIAF